jgi:uncharacterized integral membrane protein (TIGR00698 family)
VAAGIAAAAWLAQQALEAAGIHVIEALVLALLAGMLIRLVRAPSKAMAPGLAWSAKGLLEIAIVLLGASLSFAELGGAGLKLVGYALLTVVLILGLGVLIGRWLGLGNRLAALVGVGNAICGNSAIAAVAPVLRASKQEIASSIALTALLSVGVVLLLPLTAPLFSLSDAQYGALAGLVVYAVPQVVAASFAVSPESGEIGSLVKLVRVLAIGPVVVGAALLVARASRDATTAAGTTAMTWRKAVPWFVIGFLVLATLRSVGILPESWGDAVREVSRVMTIIAMAALGLSVDLSSVRKSGARVVTLVLLLTAISVTVGLLLVTVFGV